MYNMNLWNDIEFESITGYSISNYTTEGIRVSPAVFWALLPAHGSAPPIWIWLSSNSASRSPVVRRRFFFELKARKRRLLVYHKLLFYTCITRIIWSNLWILHCKFINTNVFNSFKFHPTPSLECLVPSFVNRNLSSDSGEFLSVYFYIVFQLRKVWPFQYTILDSLHVKMLTQWILKRSTM